MIYFFVSVGGFIFFIPSIIQMGISITLLFLLINYFLFYLFYLIYLILLFSVLSFRVSAKAFSFARWEPRKRERCAPPGTMN